MPTDKLDIIEIFTKFLNYQNIIETHEMLNKVQ